MDKEIVARVAKASHIRLTEEELEELFCGMAVRLLTYKGKIVRVENCTI